MQYPRQAAPYTGFVEDAIRAALRPAAVRATLLRMRAKHRILEGLLLVVGGALILACFIAPLAAIAYTLVGVRDWSDAVLGPRQWTLFLRGLGIAAGAAVLAQVLGGGLACGLAARRPRWLARVVAWFSLVVLLTPPYIYAYAWSLELLPEAEGAFIGSGAKLPAWFTTTGRAIWCIGAWTAPIAAALLHCGWRAAGRAAYQASLTDATPAQALRKVVSPTLAPWLVASLLATFVIALTENSVCDLCLQPTLNTEILGLAQLRSTPGLAILPAWPLILTALAAVALLWMFRRQLSTFAEDLAGFEQDSWTLGRRAVGGCAALFPATGAVLLLAAPFVVLAAKLRDPHAFVATWREYPGEWPDGLLYAAGAALIAVLIAVSVDYLCAWRAARRGTTARVVSLAVIAAALFVALLPPAVVGDAILAAALALERTFALDLTSNWPILSVTSAARYALIPIVLTEVSGRAATSLRHAAQIDGANWRGAYFAVRLPLAAGMLATGGLVVGLLAFTEVAATHIVWPPNVASLAITLLNKVHFGRIDQIIAMCLYLTIFVGIVVALAQACAGWRRAAR